MKKTTAVIAIQAIALAVGVSASASKKVTAAHNMSAHGFSNPLWFMRTGSSESKSKKAETKSGFLNKVKKKNGLREWAKNRKRPWDKRNSKAIDQDQLRQNEYQVKVNPVSGVVTMTKKDNGAKKNGGPDKSNAASAPTAKND